MLVPAPAGLLVLLRSRELMAGHEMDVDQQTILLAANKDHQQSFRLCFDREKQESCLEQDDYHTTNSTPVPQTIYFYPDMRKLTL